MKRGMLAKLGGSLLHWPWLGPAWQRWRASLEPEKPLWVLPGGGRIADCVRDLQTVHDLDETLCHQMALDAMKMNERLVGHLITAHSPGDSWPTHVLSVEEALTLAEQGPRPLPQNWSATSDAIALRAACAGFSQVFLLKSVGPKAGGSCKEAILHNWVDQWTRAEGTDWLARQKVACELVNLRLWLDQPP